jgi:hypothetical protein
VISRSAVASKARVDFFKDKNSLQTFSKPSRATGKK